jgi:hypothetical protein
MPPALAAVDVEDESKDPAGKSKRNEKDSETSKEVQSANGKTQSVKHNRSPGCSVSKIKCDQSYEWLLF